MTELRPFLSVLIIIATLFGMVFCKMELRRTGYTVWRLAREEKHARDMERQKKISLARVTRPDRLHFLAKSQLTLKRAEAGQIIQMTEQGIAFKQ